MLDLVLKASFGWQGLAIELELVGDLGAPHTRIASHSLACCRRKVYMEIAMTALTRALQGFGLWAFECTSSRKESAETLFVDSYPFCFSALIF